MVTDVTIKNGYKQTELGVIPADWEVTPLTELVVIQHGYGFQSQYFKPFGKYRLTTPGHFHETGGFRDVGEKQKFYEGPLPEGYLLSEGDLIVAMTEQADGLLGSAAIVPISNTYLHNQRLGKVKVLSPDLSIRFLYRVFNSKNYRAKVRETAAGTKVKHTSPSKLLEIPVPLPSTKAEQEAISTVLSDTDALIECLEKLIAKKKDIKQATMQQLLTGKIRLPGFSEEWEVQVLEEIAEIIDPHPSHRAPPENDNGIPFVGIGDISTDGKINYQTSRIVSEMIFEQHNKRYIIENGLIGIGRVASIGKVVRLLPNVGKFVVSPTIAVIKPQKVEIDLLFYCLTSKEVKGQFDRISNGSTRQSVGMNVLRDIQLFLPKSLVEQQAIADILTDMDAEIAALEQKRDKIRALKQGMMQELLTGKTRLV